MKAEEIEHIAEIVVDDEVLEKITWFYENGNVESVAYYKDGLSHGKAEKFYEDGTVETSTYYKECYMHGRHVRFLEDGIVDYDWYYSGGKEITSEVVEFLEENPPKDGLYPAYVEGYFKLKYGLSLGQLGIDVEKEAC